MLPRPGLPGFEYIRAGSPDEVVRLLSEYGDEVRLFMGGTDLLVRIRDGAIRPRAIIDVKHLPGMRDICYEADKGLILGAAVTMNQIAHHPAVRRNYPLLAEAARSVASYQLRNRATIGGNLANASPCADTAPATLVLQGEIVLHGPAGQRRVPAEQFFTGPGETVRQPDEFVRAVCFAPPTQGSAGRYLKLGRNRAGDLAVVSVAVWGSPAKTASGYTFHIALGSVAPIPLRAYQAEKVLAENPVEEATFVLAAEMAVAASSPIDDVRGSAAYRRAMVGNLTRRGLREVSASLASAPDRPAQPTSSPAMGRPAAAAEPLAGRSFPVNLTINGVREHVDVPAHMTLLQMLRERVALTGTKNGCAAGECGACTVILDGDPVNACMVLAVEADEAEIVTVEGLAQRGQLDALQQAFVDEAAVQCGFCTPGMLLSAKALLNRTPDPDPEEIREALLGNLCRCTGYGRIVKAVQRAARDTGMGSLHKEGGR